MTDDTTAHEVQSGLAWGLKASFLDYVERSGGSVELGGGAGILRSGEYYFELRDSSDFDVATLRGTIRFAGTVRLSAHAGMMSVTIVDPAVTFGDATVLDVAGTGESDGAAPRPPMVQLEPLLPVVRGDVLVWDAIPARLDPAAVELFNQVYPAGTDFDPVSIRVATADLSRS